MAQTDAILTSLATGTEVEMTNPLVAVEVAGLRAYQALGNKRPAGSANGRDYFGVSIGHKARVIGQEGEAIQVQFLEGNWKGRIGWVARSSVRVPPTEAEASADLAEGLDLIARRAIYAAWHAAGSKATDEAGRRFPFERMPTGAEDARSFLASRAEAYEEARERDRREILQRYGIDASQLERIEAEGDRKRWPLWDGLADGRGPIPAFGPVATDENGRIVMDREERAARREASIRALDAIGSITDETDTDEVWDEVTRTLGEGR